MPKYKNSNKKTVKKTPYGAQGTTQPSTTAKGTSQASSTDSQPTETRAETSSTCDKCEKRTEHLIQCEFCALWFCDTCSSISEELLSVVGDIDSLHWFCSTCDATVSEFIVNSSAVSNSGPPTSVIDKKLEAIESKLCQKIDEIEKSLKSYHTSLEEMECSDLPSERQSIATDSVASIAASLVGEEKEKERRQLNLVLHNIEESSSSDGSERKSEDIKKVTSIFEKYLEVSVSVTKAFRIGKRGTKPRLLKISVSSLDDKILVLRNKMKLRNSGNPEYVRKVFVTPDLTPTEQKKSKALRAQLVEMNKGGNNYRIKNGEIVRRVK